MNQRWLISTNLSCFMAKNGLGMNFILRPPGSPSQDKRGRARQDRDNQTIKRK